jgi:hypothetical protein
MNKNSIGEKLHVGYIDWYNFLFAERVANESWNSQGNCEDSVY